MLCLSYIGNLKGGVMFPGKFELFTGLMFGGKTSRMIFELQKAEEHGAGNAIIFKPSSDLRRKGAIMTYNGDARIAKEIPDDLPENVFNFIHGDGKPNIIAFDEVQFFAPHIYGVISELLDEGYDVYAAGLETDFRGEPFGPTLSLIGLVRHRDYWHRLLPYCAACGRKGKKQVARFSQRLIDGNPAPYHDATVKSGGKELYEPRCRECFLPPPGKPVFKKSEPLPK